MHLYVDRTALHLKPPADVQAEFLNALAGDAIEAYHAYVLHAASGGLVDCKHVSIICHANGTTLNEFHAEVDRAAKQLREAN